MYRRYGQMLGLVFLVIDLTATATAWCAAYVLRFLLWPSPDGVPDFSLVLQGLPIVLVLAAIVYRLCGLYEIHRLRPLPKELEVVGAASGMLFLLAITVTFYRRDLYESRLALGLFLAVNAVGLGVVRRGLWSVLKIARGKGLNRGRALIVGAGRTARAVAARIAQNRWTGLTAVGFVNGPGRIEPALLPRLGGIESLRDLVARHDIDHIFVALPFSRYGELQGVYQAVSGLFVEVQLVPDIPSLAGMRLRTTEIDKLTFLAVRENTIVGWRRAAKRTMDVALGAACLLVLSPLLLFLAAAVKWTSRGPVFYRQVRMGQGGRTFQMLKFRSMYVNAEGATGPVWARANDDRCTPLGRWLRRWSMDELPQLFNVLAGDMSLVGPRPERCVFVEEFSRWLPTYPQRHQVKAGITGWAQVHGWRGNSSLRRRLEFDLYYVSNWSLWLDIKILGLTLLRGLRSRHAY